MHLLAVHYDDGVRLSGDPRLRVAAGEAASIVIGDGAPSGFSMRMTATPAEPGKLNASFSIDAVPVPGVHKRATSAMLVDLGKPATIAFDERGPGMSPVRVSFTYRRL